jgi:hypothetical protein
VHLAGRFDHDFIAELETTGKDTDMRDDAAVSKKSRKSGI